MGVMHEWDFAKFYMRFGGMSYIATAPYASRRGKDVTYMIAN